MYDTAVISISAVTIFNLPLIEISFPTLFNIRCHFFLSVTVQKTWKLQKHFDIFWKQVEIFSFKEQMFNIWFKVMFLGMDKNDCDGNYFAV